MSEEMVSKKQFDEAVDALFDCFIQSCSFEGHDLVGPKYKYDHMCLSAFEHAQDLLIKLGKIKQSECCRN